MVTVKTAAALLFSGLALTAVSGLSATSAMADPPAGNNGKIHVDGADFDDTGGNEPHDACNLAIDFDGFDADDISATVSFYEQGGSPMTPIPIASGNPVVPLVNGAGSETYSLNLAGFTPNPAQGYHVHIEAVILHFENLVLSSDSKSKVIWTQWCMDPSPSPSASVEPSESVSPSESIEPSESISPSESIEPSESVSPSESIEPSESVEPSESIEPSESAEPSVSTEPSEPAEPSESASPSPSATVLGVKINKPLPSTGAPVVLLLGVGLGLMAAGCYLLVAGRARSATAS